MPLAPEPVTRPPGNITQSACDAANPTDVTAGGSGVTAFGNADLIHSEADGLGEDAAQTAPQQLLLQPVQPAATATRQQRVADAPADATQPLLAATELRVAEDPQNEAEVCPECGCYTHNTHSTPVLSQSILRLHLHMQNIDPTVVSTVPTIARPRAPLCKLQTPLTNHKKGKGKAARARLDQKLKDKMETKVSNTRSCN